MRVPFRGFWLDLIWMLAALTAGILIGISHNQIEIQNKCNKFIMEHYHEEVNVFGTGNINSSHIIQNVQNQSSNQRRAADENQEQGTVP